MSQEVDDLLKKSVELRESGRLEESILSARRASSLDPKSANAWWQLGLSIAKKDGDAAAIEHFKMTVELSPNFGFGWNRLGNAYKKVAMVDEAVESWETACLHDEEFEWNRYHLIDAYNSRELADDKQKMFDQLVELEKQDKLRDYDYHLIAMAHHNKGNYYQAVPYYKKYLLKSPEEYGYTNLSLAYSSSQVGQELDAADCCRMALSIEEDFEKAKKLLTDLEPKLNALKSKVLDFTKKNKLVAENNWFQSYVSPFELLQLDEDKESEDFEIKEIQKAKKILLQEIELEDGVVAWIPNLTIDKSRAIKLADELTDESLRRFHQIIYRYKPLLNFLSRGEVDLFLYTKDDSPIDIYNAISYDDGFAEWLSDIFVKQFDIIFSTALSLRNVDVLEALLDGRRFVTLKDDENCFASSLRTCSDLLKDLKAEEKIVESKKPTLDSINKALNKNNVGRILEILPISFQDLQLEAAKLIRSISVDYYNSYSDADTAKSILLLATNFAKKSPTFKDRLEKDTAKFDEFIEEEKKDESYLTFGKTAFHITRKGVTYGEKFISVDEIETLRWGILITNDAGLKTYEFKLAFGGKGAKTIQASWKSSTDLKIQNELFEKCENAIYSYLLAKVIERIKNETDNGRNVYIGGIPINKGGLSLKAQGWFSTKDEYCPWSTLRSEVRNGSAEITSTVNSKAQASLSLSDIDNAWILHILIKQGIMK